MNIDWNVLFLFDRINIWLTNTQFWKECFETLRSNIILFFILLLDMNSLTQNNEHFFRPGKVWEGISLEKKNIFKAFSPDWQKKWKKNTSMEIRCKRKCPFPEPQCHKIFILTLRETTTNCRLSDAKLIWNHLPSDSKVRKKSPGRCHHRGLKLLKRWVRCQNSIYKKCSRPKWTKPRKR